MKKTKHNPPRKSKPDFIKFSKVQQGYLNEIRRRQLRELNEAIESVYDELGILEKLQKAPPGTYRLRTEDFSGLDVRIIKKPNKIKDPPEGGPPAVISKDKSGKDN